MSAATPPLFESPILAGGSASDFILTHAQVLSRVPLSLAPGGGPLHLTHVRGYLVLAAPTGLAIFNTTGFSNRRAPKMILAHPYINVASAFASGDMVGFPCDSFQSSRTPYVSWLRERQNCVVMLP